MLVSQEEIAAYGMFHICLMLSAKSYTVGVKNGDGVGVRRRGEVKGDSTSLKSTLLMPDSHIIPSLHSYHRCVYV